MKKKRVCRVSGCNDVPYLGGLCKKHHDEYIRRTQRRDAAIHALHTGAVGERLPDDTSLREELLRLRQWWARACNAVQRQRDEEFMPLDEAEYALEWCITLAQEIIDAELLFRAGKNSTYDSLLANRSWVWERFNFLESGLRSNGLPRNLGK